MIGVYFFHDPYYTDSYNWRLVIKKLREKFQKLKYRNLSLNGKKILIHTTILAKIWFLATLTAIPPWALKIIKKEIFDYIWDYRQPEPIKRNTTFLPLEKGGIGLLNPEFQQQALRLNLLFAIVNPTTKKHGYILDAIGYPPQNGTGPPLYYKELINFLKDFHTQINQIKRITTTAFLRENVYKRCYGGIPTLNVHTARDWRRQPTSFHNAKSQKKLWQKFKPLYQALQPDVPFETDNIRQDAETY